MDKELFKTDESQAAVSPALGIAPDRTLKLQKIAKIAIIEHDSVTMRMASAWAQAETLQEFAYLIRAITAYDLYS